MKNILIESTKSAFKTLPNKPKNVLKRIQGVLSDFKSNRNGRIYPRELWENVLNSDYVKEMIESHGLVGELDHPEERLEISLQNVSHVINDMWIEGDSVIGIIDILPTPSGKIVNELLDYGTDIGISSRGAGSVGSGNIVDPDYQFVTFDFVARPSCEAARLNTILESVKPEIESNTDDKVNAILEGYKSNLKEGELLDKYKLNGDDQFRYMMLSRLQSDCKYVLGAGEGNMKQLWVNDNPEVHCALMRELYISLPEEPDWISLEDIDNYEKEMLSLTNKNKMNESSDYVYRVYTTVASSPGEYQTHLYQSFDSEEQAEDTVAELNAKGIRATYKPEHTEDYCIKAAADIVGDKMCDEFGTNWRSLPEDEIREAIRRFTYEYNEANVEPEYKKSDFYGDETDSDKVYDYLMKDRLNEAVMSDQEVYKTVLEWYKDNIEAGKMTLNQCYELLSDKAKVSLNKMVDQTKIRESIVNETITKLINESIEMNKKS